MRYTIGISIWKKATPDVISSGLFSFGWFGLNHIIPLPYAPDCNIKMDFLPVFDNAADAQAYARHLSRRYRFDDTASTGKKHRSAYIRRFYPVKIDTKEFPFRILTSEQPYMLNIVCHLPEGNHPLSISSYPIAVKCPSSYATAHS